jgi:hypothetical protein
MPSSTTSRNFTVRSANGAEHGDYKGKSPSAAAVKAGGRMLKSGGKSSVEVHMRELGVHNCVHVYTVSKVKLDKPAVFKIGGVEFKREYKYVAKSHGSKQI